MNSRNLASVHDATSLVLGVTSEYGKLYGATPWSPVWFRGHSDSTWPLEPGIFRKNSRDEYLYDEYQMLGEMRLMRPIEAQTYPTTFEWLVMCQHYGLPTRLLDWSESILVALFFASTDDDKDSALFVLYPAILNGYAALSRRRILCQPTYPDAILRADQSVCGSIAEVIERVKATFGRTPFYANYVEKLGGDARIKEVSNMPLAVYPPRNNARIVLQGGMFTLHGGTVPSTAHRADYGNPVALQSIKLDDSTLVEKYVVPREAKRAIRSDLGRLGIHYGALFPEFEAQTKHLRQKWSRA